MSVVGTKIVKDSDDVQRRLVDLGLSLSQLEGAILAGDAAASSSTALHPPGNAGYRRWAETVVGLREETLPEGWRMSNAQNYCTVFNQRTRVAVAVMAGDGFTGSDAGTPKSRYPKGAMTEARLRVNQQASLFPALKAPGEIVEEDCATWVLIQWEDADGVHAELSHPRGMFAQHVSAYYERILLPLIDPRGRQRYAESVSPPAVDFPVTARTSG